MPKVSTRTRQELVRIVEIWIVETKQETRMGRYEVSMKDGDRVSLMGQRYGEWFGIQKDGQNYQVTHIPTGLGCGAPLPKPAAIKLMRGLYDLVEWNFSTPAGFNDQMRPICRLMHDYCAGVSVPFTQLEKLVRIIEGRHRSGTSESQAREGWSCVYDSNNDGDCQHCHSKGGCKNIGGPFSTRRPGGPYSVIPSRNSGGIPPVASKVELGDDLPLD